MSRHGERDLSALKHAISFLNETNITKPHNIEPLYIMWDKYITNYNLASLIIRRIKKRGRKLLSGRSHSKAVLEDVPLGLAHQANGYTPNLKKKQFR